MNTEMYPCGVRGIITRYKARCAPLMPSFSLSDTNFTALYGLPLPLMEFYANIFMSGEISDVGLNVD
ncbi:MAG: hypothetical protein LBD69_01445 [Puniceicoccales bacterium]|nr:hypothetical protein [Puniceicoccales bacterium]